MSSVTLTHDRFLSRLQSTSFTTLSQITHNLKAILKKMTVDFLLDFPKYN